MNGLKRQWFYLAPVVFGNSFDGFSLLWYKQKKWRDVRVVEGGGLENRCPARDRGFESYSLRQKRNVAIFIGGE
jgi:hypothetical protein